jgi:hypothetical protein
MLQDRYGNDLTTASDAARTAYATGVDHILAATWGARGAFQEAIEADPGFALAHVGLARAAMYEGDMPGARAAMGRASALTEGVTPREAAHVAIFDLLLAGRVADARGAVRAHVAAFPRDALAAQVCTNIFGLIGMSGEPGREAAQLAYTTLLLADYGDDWWLLSVHAQALCEVGRLDEALSVMERSLAANPANANGSHFKAHTLYEAGQTDTGRAYLAEWIGGYDRRALLHGHLSWHRALWALEQGDTDEMWGLFDDAIAPGSGTSLPINVLTDSARIALAGGTGRRRRRSAALGHPQPLRVDVLSRSRAELRRHPRGACPRNGGRRARRWPGSPKRRAVSPPISSGPWPTRGEQRHGRTGRGARRPEPGHGRPRAAGRKPGAARPPRTELRRDVPETGAHRRGASDPAIAPGRVRAASAACALGLSGVLAVGHENAARMGRRSVLRRGGRLRSRGPRTSS